MGFLQNLFGDNRLFLLDEDGVSWRLTIEDDWEVLDSVVTRI